MRNAETVGIIAAAAQMGRSRCTIFDGPPLSRIFELGACRWHGIVLWGSVERSAVVSVRLSGGCKSLHDLVDAGFKFGDRQRFLKKRKWAWVLKLRLIMIDKRLLKESRAAARCCARSITPQSFGTVGTTPNVAIQKYLNGAKVPHIFISAGGRRRRSGMGQRSRGEGVRRVHEEVGAERQSLRIFVALSGYIVAQGIAHALKQCGDDLTRENLLKQATSMRGQHVKMLLPGVQLNTTPEDYAPYQSLRMAKFEGSSWKLLDESETSASAK
jgi:hypothetical protein